MGVAHSPGDDIGRGDLDIFLTNSAGNPANAASISYAIYFVDTSGGLPGVEVLIGPAIRPPVNPSVGEYYAALTIPPSASPGDYRIRWTFNELATSPAQMVVQEFAVVDPNAASVLSGSPFTAAELSLIRSLRILLRDNNPDRNYRFRPPEQEGTINQFNQVFGYIWEDYELQEYLIRALGWWNTFPPSTSSIATLGQLLQQKPEWCTAVLMQAIVHAAMALSFNWVADEFSLAGEEQVRVILPSGKEIDMTLEDLYKVVHEVE